MEERSGKNYRYPKVKVEESEDIVIALRLSKEGFGTPEDILKSSSDLVLAEVEYIKFCKDYEEVFYELNKEAK